MKRLFLLMVLLLSVTAIAAQAQDIQPIEIGQSVTGTLADGSATNQYQFSAKQGELIIVTMDSETLDGRVTVEGGADISSYVYFSDDDSGPDFNALLVFFVPQTGSYIITANTWTSDGGNYTLAVNRGNVTPLTLDQPIDVTFDAEHTAFYFSFTGQSGDVVNVRGVSSGDVDTSLKLDGPNGDQIAFDDDSGGNFDPLISNAVLPEDGTYLVALLPYTLPANGTVTVSIANSVLKSLEEGPVVFNLGDKQYEDVASFHGNAGEQVRLTLTLQSGSALSPYITLTQGQNQIAYVNMDNIQSLAFELVVPEDGDVLVRVQQYTNATMQLALERGQ
ncbi:MAG: PPC domain-containing protein [Anaerolineaceae bacterium]|nr:PPC domain-containing protein [Anaerolineaceae bacterium]